MPATIEVLNIIFTNLSLDYPNKLPDVLSFTALEESVAYLNRYRADNSLASDAIFQLTLIYKPALINLINNAIINSSKSEPILTVLHEATIFRIWHDLMNSIGLFSSTSTSLELGCDIIIWLRNLQQFSISPSEMSFHNESTLLEIMHKTNALFKTTGDLTQTQFTMLELSAISTPMATTAYRGLTSLGSPREQLPAIKLQDLTANQISIQGPI